MKTTAKLAPAPWVIGMGLAVILTACATTGGDTNPGERFRGHLAVMGGPRAGGSTFLDLQADRYATDEEIEALASELVGGGEKALFDAISAMEPMGWVRIGDRTSYHLRLIRSVDTDSGRIVRAVTDRPISFLEVIRPLRFLDYAFGIIELQLDEGGEGEGGITAAAQVGIAGNAIEIESFGNQPFRIMKVKQLRLD